MARELSLTSERVDSLRNILDADEKRRQRVLAVLDKHGKDIRPPWDFPVTSEPGLLAKNDTDGDRTKTKYVLESVNERSRNAATVTTADSFRSGIVQNVQEMLDPNITGVFNKKLVQMVVQESLSPASSLNSPQGNEKSPESLGLQIAIKLVKELDLSQDEVETLISQIENDHGQAGLREAVLRALETQIPPIERKQ